jgi:hypothetical protein
MAKTKTFDFTKPESEMDADEFQAYYAARRRAILSGDAAAYAQLVCPNGKQSGSDAVTEPTTERLTIPDGASSNTGN